jgi:Fe-S-cluster-containing hydrogenase component 2
MKKCAHDAMYFTDNLARINYEKCTACGDCADVCPTKAIRKCDMIYAVELPAPPVIKHH